MLILKTIDPIWFLVALLFQILFLLEVVMQIRLQMKLIPILPVEARHSLPKFPNKQQTSLFASIPFQKAFWDYVFLDHTMDSGDISKLKKKIRASIKRKIAFALIDLIVILALLTHP